MQKIIRKATNDDLPIIISMLADDDLGKQREVVSKQSVMQYEKAFEAIKQDHNAELLILAMDGEIVGTAQVNYITYLTYQGGKRAQIEAVRIHKDHRGQQLGEFMILEIIQRAKKRHCHMVQLTTNKSRDRAKLFYEKLGFTATHEGMKLFI